jgi:hypothetical protein
VFKRKIKQITIEQAEELAARAFYLISKDEDKLNAFLMQSGLELENLRESASSEHFLESVMDFMTSSDALVLEFCQQEGLAPETLLIAAQKIKRYKHLD